LLKRLATSAARRVGGSRTADGASAKIRQGPHRPRAGNQPDFKEVRLSNANELAQAASAAHSPFSAALAGKTIFVTGGASGLGAALCRELSSCGAEVMVGDLHRDRAEVVAKSLRGNGAGIQSTECDVGNPKSAERAITAALEAFGKIDVLINNAGTDVTCPLEELDYEAWDRVMHTNLYGPYLMSRLALPHLRKTCGQIVNIASTAAKRAWPNASAYHASKCGLLGLSHALHAELRPQKIKVTAIIAGGMRTPFLLDRFPDIDVSTLQDPASVASTIRSVLLLPEETVIPEIMILPMKETSWP
jgi:NAD(P)-dependent dehydrogenase (short-subunit alcohol dehydrogenase family)